jgi:hypothetical protein
MYETEELRHLLRVLIIVVVGMPLCCTLLLGAILSPTRRTDIDKPAKDTSFCDCARCREARRKEGGGA